MKFFIRARLFGLLLWTTQLRVHLLTPTTSVENKSIVIIIMQVEETITTGTATTATADDAIANVHELVLCQARGKGATMLRESYEARLRTFSSLQYFAKPACLSPLVCARLG